MTIEPGTTLLHYRVVDKVGEGGMGVVWRAVDTTLDREVALKVLPEGLGADAERMMRFEREARLLASLNHPHVATIHGLHECDGARFLTMELVRGEDLTQAIARGLSVERAVEIAVEICDALEAAHASGVVHRDLKPANVMLTAERRVKVLDFGLAKALGVGPLSGDGSGGPTESPTITSAGTIPGVILGTAAYMSPEQARGRELDRRVDLWAFGCLLYEMLAGKRAFSGETISDTIASVLKEDPDWSALPPDTPPAVRRLLRRCLAKDPRRRVADAADARLELREAFDPVPADESDGMRLAAANESASRRASRLPWAIAALAVVLAIAGWAVGRAPAPDRPLIELAAPLPDGIRFDDDQSSSLALSPDGRTLVVTGRDDDGRAALYLRRLDSDTFSKIDGTDDAENPVFSPDGAWIAFVARDELRKVSTQGGAPVRVADRIGASRGMSWGADDRIVTTLSFESPLFLVPAEGGAPEPITTLDEASGERTHRWPHYVAEHGVVFFTVGTKDSPEYYGSSRIDAVRVGSGERTTVFEGASFARWVPTGHLLLGRDGVLWALPFDIASLRATGTAVPVLPEVMGARNSGVVYLDVSQTGLLAVLRGLPEDPEAILTWRAFDGTSTPVEGAARGAYGDVALSPDGKRVAVSLLGDSTFDIWVLDLARNIPVRLTFDGDNTLPTWTPDGRWILYYSVRQGLGATYRKAADGSGTETRVSFIEGRTTQPEDVASDGRTLMLAVFGDQKGDLYRLDLEREGAEPEPFVVGPGDQSLGKFSPDGRWFAYTTDASGNFEVMVRSTTDAGGLWQVSREGGVLPRWSRDGRHLFFRSGRELYGVDVLPDATAFRGGPPRLLLDDLDRAALADSYDVAPDGKAILVPITVDAEGPPRDVTVLVNWLDHLARQAPPR